MTWVSSGTVLDDVKNCCTHKPPDGGGGLRWSTERFSSPEGSSNRGGGGRTLLVSGKCDCDLRMLGAMYMVKVVRVAPLEG